MEMPQVWRVFYPILLLHFREVGCSTSTKLFWERGFGSPLRSPFTTASLCLGFCLSILVLVWISGKHEFSFSRPHFPSFGGTSHPKDVIGHGLVSLSRAKNRPSTSIPITRIISRTVTFCLGLFLLFLMRNFVLSLQLLSGKLSAWIRGDDSALWIISLKVLKVIRSFMKRLFFRFLMRWCPVWK